MTGESEARLAEVRGGYDVSICRCEGGPYLGARKAGTPCCCEGCGFMTQEQYDALAQAIAADERDVAAGAWDEGWEAAAAAIDEPGYGTAALRLRHLARTGRARADRLTATGDQP